MKIKPMTQYGIRMVLYMAERGNTCSRLDICQTVQIPINYFNAVATPLKQHGLINVAFGPNGGFSLAKPAEQITMFDVYTIYEGELDESYCHMCDENCIDREERAL